MSFKVDKTFGDTTWRARGWANEHGWRVEVWRWSKGYEGSRDGNFCGVCGIQAGSEVPWAVHTLAGKMHASIATRNRLRELVSEMLKHRSKQ